MGGLIDDEVYVPIIGAIKKELPKWRGGPTLGAMPKTALELIEADVEAKMKLIALTIVFGPDYMANARYLASKIGDEQDRWDFETMISRMVAAKSLDEYHAKSENRDQGSQ